VFQFNRENWERTSEHGERLRAKSSSTWRTVNESLFLTHVIMFVSGMNLMYKAHPKSFSKRYKKRTLAEQCILNINYSFWDDCPELDKSASVKQPNLWERPWKLLMISVGVVSDSWEWRNRVLISVLELFNGHPWWFRSEPGRSTGKNRFLVV
jgi:hypothetical protein